LSIRTRRKPMRALAAAAAAAVGASLLAIAGPAPVGAAPTVTEQTRIAGADRYATANAVALAKANSATNIGTVVLVSGENFPDGLSAAALAGALDAPMLLTQAAALPTSVLTTLTTMTSTATVKNVVIVGGTAVRPRFHGDPFRWC
jgi:putative cell wall-binding protein